MIFPGVIAASGKGDVMFYIYGSGTPAVHGTFIPDGIYNGLPQYKRLDDLVMVWADGDGEYRISDYGDYSPANTYFRNNKQSGVTPWEGTAWIAVNGLGVPIVSLTPLNELSMLVTGAGSADVNQLYLFAGMLNGFKSYTPTGAGDPTLDGIYNDGVGRWEMRANNGGDARRYRSSDAVATPDLITTWGAVGLGVPPYPTVTAV